MTKLAYLHTRLRLAIALVVLFTWAVAPVQAQITTPREHLGFNIGDDYHLVTYTQYESYVRKLAEESPRMVLEEIGQTAEGRPHLMAIITSPENHRNLARYKEISRRLAMAEGLTDDEARTLADEGKAVVWIDGGLHGTEIVGTHQLPVLIYEMVSRTDAETMRFLENVILLAPHANPDGMELVSSWYMRHENPEDRSTRGIPRLYHWYVGHDNNRDGYMNNMPETENMSRVLYREWFPQIMYNPHQTGPVGTILFAPPFRDPFNYNIDPLVIMGIEGVAAEMHGRLIAEGKFGSTMRSGAGFSTWWNGGQRTTPYWHNMIGLLTEINGNPTPMDIPLVPNRQLAHSDLPYPVPPQRWHFQQAIDWSITIDRAVIDYGARNRDKLLYNQYIMAKNSIERGSRDHWTIHPQRIAALEEAATGSGADVATANVAGYGARGVPAHLYEEVLHDPDHRDPRGYILPADQADFPTATKFVNTLMKSGVAIHRATADFRVGGKSYPQGSYVVKAAQAYRPFVIDMFEPQDHPNDFAYPGGPPIAPYDATGWTLAFQMGVEFDRILDGFDGPFEMLEDFAETPAGTVSNAQGARGFMLSHDYVDAFTAINRLMDTGENVYWLSQPVTADGTQYPAGTTYIRSRRGTQGRLEQMASELGLDFHGVSSMPRTDALQLGDVRIGLWDRYGGSMPSGWTRWLFEQFEFPFEVVYPPRLDQGNLNRDFDVLVFPTGAIPDEVALADEGPYSTQNFDPATVPEEYRDRLGGVSTDVTVPQLREFLEEGGTIIAIGTSANVATHLGLPVGNHLVDGSGNDIPREEYFIPGSILQTRVDNTNPVAYGMGEHVDMMFNRSPVLRLEAGAEAQGVRRVAWYDSAAPLRSGWAWGQEHVRNGLAAVEADVGDGKLYIFAPEVLYRGQPHKTFTLVFNGIYLANAEEQTAN
jgi:hypothetical protein